MFNPTPKFLELFAHTAAMMETLAENRTIAQELFQFLGDEHIEKFQKDLMIVIHYIDQTEFKED